MNDRIKLDVSTIKELFNSGVQDANTLRDEVMFNPDSLLSRIAEVNESLKKIRLYYPLDIANFMHSLMLRIYILGMVIPLTCRFSVSLQRDLIQSVFDMYGIDMTKYVYTDK